MSVVADSSSRSPRSVVIWLYALAGLIAAIIAIGGITRLTESGLSIPSWEPIVGVVPPLSETAWRRAFEDYQTTYEYRAAHFWMTIEDFKRIYLWEWLHRLSARMAGLAAAIPMIVFHLRGALRPRLVKPLSALLALGAFQGVLGWMMVRSGLSDGVDVDPPALAAHLCLAFILLGFVLTLAHGERIGVVFSWRAGIASRASRRAMALLILIFVQIALGALTAGSNAGFIYNQWPLMGEGPIPPDYLPAQGMSLSFPFHHPPATQFHHRIFAYATLIFALWNRRALDADLKAESMAYDKAAAAAARRSATGVLIALTWQAASGVTALLAAVPLWAGVLHQWGGMVIFALALHHFLTLSRPYGVRAGM